jgi:hypothetical protein
MRLIGPTTPPARMEPASQGKSLLFRDGSIVPAEFGPLFLVRDPRALE